jgi:hypothetical protein
MSKTNYIICGVCGYISTEDEELKQCPACGAPITSFSPYELNVSEKRLKILDAKIHPLLTHFPSAITLLQFILFIMSFFAPVILGINIGYGGVLDLFVIMLPIFVVLTILAGIVDGKNRYNQVNTPYLKRKIIFGTSLLVIGIIIIIFHILSANGTNIFLVILEGILMFIALALNGMLSKIGGELICGIVPKGKVIN